MILRTEDIDRLAMRQKANVEELLSSIGKFTNDFIKQKKAIDECLEKIIDIAFLNECKKKGRKLSNNEKCLCWNCECIFSINYAKLHCLELESANDGYLIYDACECPQCGELTIIRKVSK